MTCHDCREKLLRTADPSAPATEIAAHLAQCDECRQYRDRLLQVEANVARIPAPPSRGPEVCKRALLQVIAADPIVTARTPAPRRIRRSLTWAALAASVLIAAIGVYWSMNRPGPDNQPIAKQSPTPKTDEKSPTYVAQLLDCDLKLAENTTPAQKTKTLAVLTGLIEDAIESKPGKTPLQTLARLHHNTLFSGLLPIAQKLPPAEREEILTPIIDDLVRFHDEQVVVLAPEDPAEQEIVDSITKDIHDVWRQLRNLLPPAAKSRAAASPPRRKVTVDWQRDLPLIEALATTGRKLALEPSPLKRAEEAHDLAEKMGKVIQRAADQGDAVRAAEYGQYVHDLLSGPVAHNMAIAQTVEQAPSQADLDRFAKAVSRSSKAIEADLQRAGMGAAGDAVSKGRLKVENSVKDMNRPPSDKN